MPRFRRQLQPGQPVHIICRFFRRDYVLELEGARAQYLQRLKVHIVETSWSVFSYALMSSHIHLGAMVGTESFEVAFQPLHSGFAAWVHQRHGLVGHIFAGRPATHLVAPVRCARLVAYHHNNPVKAAVVTRARESGWTSHRAYMDPTNRPEWLNVALGLGLAGFDDTPAGRAAFEEAVDANPNDEFEFLNPDRSAVRERLGSAAELAHPHLTDQGRSESAIVARPDAELRTWQGPIAEIIECVADALGLRPWDITSASRRRPLANGRRLCVLVALLLGSSRTAIASALGITQQAATKLERSAAAEHRSLAEKLATMLISTAGDLVR